MVPPSLHIENQLKLASQLQVHRLYQDLANAQKKLVEYEELIVLLYTALYNIQTSVCKKCKVNFEKFAPADLATYAPPAVAFSTSGFAQPPPSLSSPSGSGGSGNVSVWRRIFSGRRGPHPHSPNPGLTNTGAALAAPSQPTVPALPRSNQTTSTSSQVIHTSAISFQQTTVSSEDKPAVFDWSVTFNTRIKTALGVKLVDVLVFNERVSCVRFSSDGNYLAAGLRSGETYIYIVKDNALTKACVLVELSTTNVPPKRDVIWSMSFSPDGKYLATGNESAIIRVWDVARKHARNVFRHERGVSGVDFSPDGRFLVSCSHDGKVCIWSMRDGSSRVFLDTQARYYSLRLSPDGRYIAATDYPGMLRIWDFRSGQRVKWRAHSDEKKDRPPATIAFMPDGKGLVTGSWDKTLKYWDVSSLDSEVAQEETLEQKEILTFHGHTNVVRGVTISPDGRWVISASSDLTMRIWDSRTGVQQCEVKGHKDDIWWVDFSTAGHYFASGGNDERVAIWKCETI